MAPAGKVQRAGYREVHLCGVGPHEREDLGPVKERFAVGDVDADEAPGAGRTCVLEGGVGGKAGYAVGTGAVR